MGGGGGRGGQGGRGGEGENRRLFGRICSGLLHNEQGSLAFE